ncbi:hypothetical protein PLESHI_00205 [Plesiomonas shigelloides 302-73]|uniref:Uncharacterized protein n=1 Tax=Plesiomonas shigelloides 302-73 TaxID=1315976 RepID=R8AVW4_PLESH|nr:hypothetical protein PLESHI_00205 [Plesiomonas shigelloides 302-73]
MYLFCSFSYAAEVIDGPYKISNDHDFFIAQKSQNENCPIDLIVTGGKTSYVIDRLCVNGDLPKIRSTFFITLKGVNHIGVIVSWYNKHQAEGIEQTDYQVTIYKKNNDGMYSIDKDKNNDRLFYGVEDGTGDGSYKFNNAKAVKLYLKSKYG